MDSARRRPTTGCFCCLGKGQRISRKDITRRLVEILYERNDVEFRRGTFRVRGDIIEVYPTYDETADRIELFGDEIESLSQISSLFGTVKQKYARLPTDPKSHYVVQPEQQGRGHRFDCDGSRTRGPAGTEAAGADGGGAADSPADALRPEMIARQLNQVKEPDCYFFISLANQTGRSPYPSSRAAVIGRCYGWRLETLFRDGPSGCSRFGRVQDHGLYAFPPALLSQAESPLRRREKMYIEGE